MPFIEFRDITKRYDGFPAVESLAFSVEKGEIFSIIGPNGAGKSTILKLICGLISQTAGSILIDGLRTDRAALSRVIGYMPEESALYEGMAVRDYLSFFADLYDIPAEAARKRITELMEFLGLEDRQIETLSKGMRRKVLLARSLVNSPGILIYDEPASGLDPVIARNLLDHIQKLKGEGKTIIMSAHDLSHVEEISDRIMILNRGRIDILGSINDIRRRYGASLFTLTISSGKKSIRKSFSDKASMLRFINSTRPHLSGISAKERSLQEIFVEKFKNG